MSREMKQEVRALVARLRDERSEQAAWQLARALGYGVRRGQRGTWVARPWEREVAVYPSGGAMVDALLQETEWRLQEVE